MGGLEPRPLNPAGAVRVVRRWQCCGNMWLWHWHLCPVWARERCRISLLRILAECCKRQLDQGSFVLLYFRLFTFSDLYWVWYWQTKQYRKIQAVKWLAVKTASEMTYIVSSGALNSTQTKRSLDTWHHCLWATLICSDECQFGLLESTM